MKRIRFLKKLIPILRSPSGEAVNDVIVYLGRIIRSFEHKVKKIGVKRITFFTAVFFAALSFLVVVEKNFDGENWCTGSALLDAVAARKNKVPLMDYLNDKYPQENWSTSIYETSLMFIPLWQSLLYLGLKIFGSISFGARFWLALMGFSTVMLVYYIGKKVYNRGVGLIAALTLATLPYYVIHVKSGFGYYAIMPLLVLLLFYFFYLAHQKRKKRFLYLSGLIIFLIIFNGWPTIMLAGQIMLVFVLINFRYKKILQIPKLLRWKKILRFPAGLRVFWSESLDGKGGGHLLGLRDYILMLVIGGGLFFLFGLLFAWYFGGPTLDVFEKIYAFWYTSRASWFNDRAFLDSKTFWTNISNLGRSLFWKMPFNEAQGYLTILITPEYPMFVPFISFFWLVGIIIQIKRRSLFDKLCLTWIFFQIIGTTIFAGFTPRNWLFATPCIVLTTGVGITEIIKFLTQKIKRRIYLAKAITALIIIVFIYYIIAGYHYYFFYFIKHNSFLAKAAKEAEIVKYVTRIASPKNSLIVLDENHPSPKEGFYYFSSGKKYETIYYQPEVIQAMGEHDPKNLAQWEREVLARKEKIVYVVSEANYSHYPYGMKLWQPIGMYAFNAIHTDMLPTKVIYYANGTPATSIYVITRDNLPLDETNLKLKKNSDSYFWAEKEGRVDYLQLEGPLNDARIYFNDNSFAFLPQIRPGEKLKLSRQYSQINFTPLTNLKDSETVILESKNVKMEQETGSVVLTATASGGYVIYKITNLLPIKEILSQTYPVINNDPEGKNKITMQFSPNGKKYKTIYEIKSNKKGYSEIPYEKIATHFIKTKGKEIYLKFIFEGKPGETKLFSQESHPTIFKAKGEGWLPENLILKKGLNKVSFQAKQENLNLTFASKAGISKVHSFGFMEHREEKEFAPASLENGLYRFWLAAKTEDISLRKEDQGVKLKISEGEKVQTLELALTQDDLNTKHKFLDFYLWKGGTAQVIKNKFQEKNFLDFWAVIDNENFLPARDYASPPSVVISDAGAISQKPVYASEKGTQAKEVISKNVKLAQGQYFLRIIARFKPDENKEVARLIIDSLTREKNLENISLGGRNFKNREKGQYQEFIATFRTENPEEEINFKVEFLGKSRIWLDRLEVISVKQTVEAETLSRTVASRIVKDTQASGGEAVFTGFKDSLTGGHILFGSLVQKLEAGDYLVFYRMKASDNKYPKTMTRIDLTSAGPNFDSREIWCSEFSEPNKYQYFSFLLNQYDPTSTFGFNALWYPKGAEVWVDKIEFGKIILEFPAEDLTPEGIVVSDPEARGDKAVLIQSPEEVRRELIEGTIDDPQAQDLRIILRIKVKDASPAKPIAKFTLAQIPEGRELQRVIIKEEFREENQYQDITLDIQNNSRKPIKFNLEFLGEGELWVDYVDVIPLE